MSSAIDHLLGGLGVPLALQTPGFYLYYPNLRHKPPALAALIETLRR